MAGKSSVDEENTESKHVTSKKSSIHILESYFPDLHTNKSHSFEGRINQRMLNHVHKRRILRNKQRGGTKVTHINDKLTFCVHMQRILFRRKNEEKASKFSGKKHKYLKKINR